MSEWLIKLAKEKLKKSEKAGEDDRFAGYAAANALLTDLEKTPHAFVLACVMDKQIKASKAWEIPYKISKRLVRFQ